LINPKRLKRREEKRREEVKCVGGIVRDTECGRGREARHYISGYEVSQTVLLRPSGKGNAYDRN
jgi:hypothetical protein